ncbi:MAG: GntR family transcriptional regulator [Acidimicrobiales bacterium]|jgi:GntR family transcriptional regulator|nr:GntR family transcriptional regulator [Acidimicrobiales bacterium]
MQSPSVLHLPGPTGRPRQMVLRLDADTTIPLFEQLRAQLSVMVAVGRLEPGSRLPTVRYMATQLNLAPGTIARTYRELERDGVLEGRGRTGTFVVDEPAHSEPVQERRERTETAAQRFAFELRQLGVGLDAAREALDRAFRELEDSEMGTGA